MEKQVSNKVAIDTSTMKNKTNKVCVDVKNIVQTFVNFNGRVLRLDSKESKIALKKTAEKLGLYQSYVRKSIDSYIWGSMD